MKYFIAISISIVLIILAIFAELLNVSKFSFISSLPLADRVSVATIIGVGVTAIGVVVAAFGVVVAVHGVFMVRTQIEISNSIRRTEVITNLYKTFITDDMYPFYARIRNKQLIDWEQKEDDERRLNKSLTLFDEVCYLQTQNLFHENDDAWEYIASEIHYFASNDSVWDYWAYRVQDGLDRRFPKDIIPFTGFSQLYKTIPDNFKADKKHFPPVPEKHKELFDKMTSS